MPAINATRALRQAIFGLTVSCFAASALATSAVAAQDMPNNLRGTITDVSDQSITVKSTTDGSSHDVMLGDDTRLAAVRDSSLDNIKEGTFIGTANVPGEDGQPAKALEMVIFPDSMKGTGEGDYPWDTPRGAGDSNTGGEKLGGSGSGSTMTNGTVSSTGSDDAMGDEAGDKLGGASSGSTMTNGTVDSAADENGMMTLTVDYGDGSKQIRVPSDVPTVMVSKGSKDDLEQGAAVFVAGDITQDPIQAKIVIVGIDGTIPPM